MNRFGGWDPTIPFETKQQSNLASVMGDSFDIIDRMSIVYPIRGKDIILVNSLLLPEECLSLISASESCGFGRTDFPKRYRGNLRLMLDDPSLAAAIWDRVKLAVPEEVEEDQCKWKAIGLNECFRVAKYVPGDVFGAHVDTSFKRSTEEKSMYTVNIYLNGDQDFQGGSTRFYNQSRRTDDVLYAVAPSPGLALIFRQPPSACYNHDGEEVRDGTTGLKYLLRTDVMYRKQRSENNNVHDMTRAVPTDALATTVAVGTAAATMP